MARNFHENTDADQAAMPTDRSTGLVFAAVALIVAAVYRSNLTVVITAMSVAAGLALVSMLAPVVLRPLNVAWFKFGLLLHRIVNPLIMLVIFLVAFVPFGWILRWRSDPLRSRRTTTGTYWVAVDLARRKMTSMTNQF